MSKDNNNINLKTKDLRINITNNPKVPKAILQKLGNRLISNSMLRKKYLINNLINNNLINNNQILTNDL